MQPNGSSVVMIIIIMMMVKRLTYSFPIPLPERTTQEEDILAGYQTKSNNFDEIKKKLEIGEAIVVGITLQGVTYNRLLSRMLRRITCVVNFAPFCAFFSPVLQSNRGDARDPWLDSTTVLGTERKK